MEHMLLNNFLCITICFNICCVYETKLSSLFLIYVGEVSGSNLDKVLIVLIEAFAVFCALSL